MVKHTLTNCLTVFDHFVGLELKVLEAKFGDNLLSHDEQKSSPYILNHKTKLLVHIQSYLTTEDKFIPGHVRVVQKFKM